MHHQPHDGDTRTCPNCGGMAIYRSRAANVEVEGDKYKGKGWYCSNGTCDFYEALPMDVPS